MCLVQHVENIAPFQELSTDLFTILEEKALTGSLDLGEHDLKRLRLGPVLDLCDGRITVQAGEVTVDYVPDGHSAEFFAKHGPAYVYTVGEDGPSWQIHPVSSKVSIPENGIALVIAPTLFESSPAA